jgi:hypothetical protein
VTKRLHDFSEVQHQSDDRDARYRRQHLGLE